MQQFVDVILPLPLAGTYTYSVPTEYLGKVVAGSRVSVPLGKSKHYTALIAKVHNNKPEEYTVRPFTELLDEQPTVLASQMKLWEWMSQYYMCSLGEIFKAAVPQGLKGEFRPKTEQHIKLSALFGNPKARNLIEQSLSRAPRQKRLLATFLQLTEQSGHIQRHKLIEAAGVSPNICKELTDKGYKPCGQCKP